MSAWLAESRQVDGDALEETQALDDMAASLGHATAQAFIDAQTAEGRGIYERFYPSAGGTP